MSDRLNLWPKRAEWATVNVTDHSSMSAAIRAFANWSQVLKVFGPPSELARCYRLWKRIEKSDDIPPADITSWYVAPEPDGLKNQKVQEWKPR